MEMSLLLTLMIYASSFFVLGLFMLFCKLRTQGALFSRGFLFLSVFGFTHGIHELFVIATQLGLSATILLGFSNLFFLAGSFFSLFMFSVEMIRGVNWARGIPIGAALMWILSTGMIASGTPPLEEVYRFSSLLARWGLGFAGSFLLGYAFLRVSQRFRVKGLSKPARNFILPSVGFFLYSAFGGLITFDIYGVSIYALRGFSAAIITITVVYVFWNTRIVVDHLEHLIK